MMHVYERTIKRETVVCAVNPVVLCFLTFVLWHCIIIRYRIGVLCVFLVSHCFVEDQFCITFCCDFG